MTPAVFVMALNRRCSFISSDFVSLRFLHFFRYSPDNSERRPARDGNEILALRVIVSVFLGLNTLSSYVLASSPLLLSAKCFRVLCRQAI